MWRTWYSRSNSPSSIHHGWSRSAGTRTTRWRKARARWSRASRCSMICVEGHLAARRRRRVVDADRRDVRRRVWPLAVDERGVLPTELLHRVPPGRDDRTGAVCQHAAGLCHRHSRARCRRATRGPAAHLAALQVMEAAWLAGRGGRVLGHPPAAAADGRRRSAPGAAAARVRRRATSRPAPLRWALRGAGLLGPLVAPRPQHRPDVADRHRHASPHRGAARAARAHGDAHRPEPRRDLRPPPRPRDAGRSFAR